MNIFDAFFHVQSHSHISNKNILVENNFKKQFHQNIKVQAHQIFMREEMYLSPYLTVY